MKSQQRPVQHEAKKSGLQPFKMPGLEIDCSIRMTTPMLGTAPADPEIYKKFIESKRPPSEEHPASDAEEGDETETLPTVEEEVAKGMTVFHRLNGAPFIYDYQIKGYLKDACGMLRRLEGTESHKLKAHKRVIDGLVFVNPRCIPLILPPGKEIISDGFPAQRPLRSMTPKGERVCLAISEAAPEGTKLHFRIQLMDEKLESVFYEWMQYGQLRGLGQWRNGSWGRFVIDTLNGRKFNQPEPSPTGA